MEAGRPDSRPVPDARDSAGNQAALGTWGDADTATQDDDSENDSDTMTQIR